MSQDAESKRALSNDEIKDLLATSRGRGTKVDPTRFRDIGTWFKLDHFIKEDGCDNEECLDSRPKTDLGTNIVTVVKGRACCRVCFLAGWLLDE